LIINADAGFGFAINVEDHSILAFVSTSAVDMFFAIFSFFDVISFLLFCFFFEIHSLPLRKGRLTVAQAMPKKKKVVNDV